MNMNIFSNCAEAQVSVPVCKLNNLLPGIGVGALVNGLQVAVFRLRNGDIFAVGNRDPFSDANVLSRGLTGSLKGCKVVASPIYKKHFDLVTGICLEDTSVRIPVYAVQVDGVERRLPGKFNPVHNHARHPEEKNVISCFKHGSGIKVGIIRGFIRPAEC